MLGDDAYADATRSLVAFVERHLLRDGDRLWRTVRDGRGGTPAFAEDYLALADGLLGAHAALGDAGRCSSPDGWPSTAVRDFWDDEAGTFVDTSDEHDRTVARPRGLVDNATPSANAIGADLLQRLALLTGEEDFARRARSIIRAVAPALEQQPSAFGRMLSAADRIVGEQVDVVVATAAGDDGRGAPRGGDRPVRARSRAHLGRGRATRTPRGRCTPGKAARDGTADGVRLPRLRVRRTDRATRRGSPSRWPPSGARGALGLASTPAPGRA